LAQLGFQEPPAAEAGVTVRAGTRPALPFPEAREGESCIQRFGDYELLGEIAQGGMGVVYKARQLSLNRTVAVKMIRSGAFASKEFVQRFRVEASAAAVLQHPNIVAVHEVGVHEGQHFFSMDYVAGQNLAQMVRDGPLPANRAARYVQRIAEAIHYAHQSGILHRDLKPSNVLVDQNDQPRVTDFGLAKQLNSESSATLTGEVMGTPGYMPPEQASGNRGAVKAWSDVYSLGAILYHLLTGRAPFAAGSLEETLNQVLHQDPVSLRLLNPAVPRDLDTICLKCLEKEPTKRYSSAQLLAEELTRFLNQEPILARPLSTVGKAARWCRRKPALATALGLVLLVAIGSPIAAFRINRARHAEQRERQRAQATVTSLEITAANHLLENDKGAEALAYLARVLRREPTNRVAAERILSALAYRNFCLPLARLQHQGEVTAAQFSPDGQQVLTAARDKSARIWASDSGRLLTEFKHTNEVLTAQFSPDGQAVVTASGDELVRIWSASTAQLTRVLRHEAPVLSAEFDSDGRRVVTGSQDQAVRVWETTGAVLAGPFRFRGPADWVQFSTDGTFLAVMSWGRPGAWVNTSWVIEADSGKALAMFPGSVYSPDVGAVPPCRPHFNWEMGQVFAGNNISGVTMPVVLWTLKPKPALRARVSHKAMVHATALSPDGRLAATASQDHTAQLWDAHDGKQLAGPLRHQDWVLCLQFSPDGRRLATGSKDNTAQLWDSTSGQPLSEPLQHQSAVVTVRFSDDGQRLLTKCVDASVWVWSIRARQSIARTLQHALNVRMATFSPDNRRIATVEWLGGLRVWSTGPAPLPLSHLRIEGAGQSQNMQFSPDGRWLAVARGSVGGASGLAQIWDTSLANPSPLILSLNKASVGLESVRFDPASQYIVAAGADTNAIVWELSTARIVSELSHSAASHFACFSPDGLSVLTASYDKTAQLWDWRTGRPRFPKGLRHDDRVVCADLSPDSKWIGTLSRDKTARIWDARTGEMVMPPLQHTEEPYHYNSIQFSPNAQSLVTAAGNAVQVWEIATGRARTSAMNHNARINSVRFSPDSKRIVTACADGTARIWNVETGHLLGEPCQHQDRVNYAEFSPDGRWIVTASVDGTARLWEVPLVRFTAPTWLTDLADAVAGQRLLEGNINEVVTFEKSRDLRESLLRASSPDETAYWARWLLTDSPTRAISPSSPVSLTEYVQGRIQDDTFESLKEAAALSPTNALAQAKLTLAELTNKGEEPRQMARADWQTRRASQLAPGDPEVLWATAQSCERLGRLTEALEKMSRASSFHSNNASFWNAWGRMLAKTNRLDEAERCYTRAIELSGPWKDSRSPPATAWLNRAELFRKLNRRTDATADNLKGLNLPTQDVESPATAIDLSLHYNVSTDMKPRQGSMALLAGLPLGRTNLAGIDFDARGSVQLAGDDYDAFPREVTGIRIDQKCRHLHFLHSTLYSAFDGSPIGAYRVHYTDGQHTNLVIQYGDDLRNRLPEQDPRPVAAATELVSADGSRIRFYKRTWNNPRPEVSIASLDFVSHNAGAAPFLIAITTEP
jgi:WD40 repeat protein/tRNA A-37 threonylcarbamoyl transferase component Bud32/tetratricopeptide (TPR) repeat protein